MQVLLAINSDFIIHHVTNYRSCMLVVLWHARHHKADVSTPNSAVLVHYA